MLCFRTILPLTHSLTHSMLYFSLIQSTWPLHLNSPGHHILPVRSFQQPWGFRIVKHVVVVMTTSMIFTVGSQLLTPLAGYQHEPVRMILCNTSTKSREPQPLNITNGHTHIHTRAPGWTPAWTCVYDFVRHKHQKTWASAAKHHKWTYTHIHTRAPGWTTAWTCAYGFCATQAPSHSVQ